MSKAEIVIPSLFITYERPKKPNNYSVYIPKNKNDRCQIYINNRWFEITIITQDKTKQEELDENKVISDKEYKLLKAIRRYRDEED